MLCLPGEFLPTPEIPNSAPNTLSSFTSSFQKLMRTQRAAPSLHHPCGLTPFIPRELKDSSMVLVRHDGVRRPLQAPYDGPFPVLEAGEKVFKILKNGLPYTVSVDRLKPCNMPVTPPLSSIIPNCSAPPPHPSAPDYLRRTPAQTRAPRPSAVPPMVPLPEPVEVDASTLTSGHGDSGSSPFDLNSNTEFPKLAPPVYTSSGRQSRPKVRLNL